MPVVIKPDVVDCSVHNSIEDWSAVKNYGIRGIIHKATEGVGFVDKRYGERLAPVRRVGMLWGAYHFMNAAPADQQARHFLRHSHWDKDMLLCLDWEPYGANTASLASAKEFLRIVYEETGQRPVLYSGNLVKEQGRGDPFLCQHRLWLAQYAPRPQLPRGWDKYWLWQFGGDGHNHPGIIPGISTKGMDVNVFGGDDLLAEWAGRTQDRRLDPVPEPAPSIAAGPEVAPAPTPEAPDNTVMSHVVVASTNAAAINELASQGSRLAELFRSVKQRFWKSAATVTATGAGASTLVDTTKGNGAGVSAWAQAHPVAFGCIVGGVIGLLLGGAVLYFVIKRAERWLTTAYNAGRYSPRSEA